VALTGATPVFADIELNYFNIDPQHVESLISSKTKAIMPVHLYGHPASLVELKNICTKHNLLLFEDAAQAVAASFNSIPVGTWGYASSFSFYPTKNMTSGEGGMVTTKSDQIARKVRLLRNQGMERRYQNEIIGFNTRMTDIHAAIGRVQLNKLARWTEIRQQNAAFLSENISGVVVPPIAPGAVHVFHQYTIRIEGFSRDDFSLQLSDLGVGNGVYYPTPIHRLPSFGQSIDLPTTEVVARQCLSIPVHPSLSQQDLETIVEAVNKTANAGS
jgi:dTDP-4-amino-4,6-dideoxygalactose transaminase